MQNLWHLKLEWYKYLPSDFLQDWKQFLLKLEEINDTVIYRYIFEDNPDKIELHGFVDTSGKAYAAAIYLRSLPNNSRFS